MRKPASQKVIKESNLKLVFRLIYEHGNISRAHLAKLTKLSPTTISSLTDELIKKKLIMTTGTGELPSSGRKPVMLSVNPEGGCIICVDLHKTGYYAAIYDLSCRLKKEYFINLSDYSGLGISLISTVDIVLKENKCDKDKLIGICIGAPGIIDPVKMRIISSTIIPVNKDNNFYDVIKSWFPDKKIELINESSLSAYCEKEFGKHIKNETDLLYIDVHEGIGAGIVINGQIFKGLDNMAGEFGHISIAYDGPLCKCGNRGCIESFASQEAIINNLCTELRMNERQLSRYLDTNPMNLTEGAALKYKKGDGPVVKVINDTAYKLACAINNGVNLLNPQLVVIGGKITVYGEGFLNCVREAMKKIGLGKNADIKIYFSDIKDNPVTKGGAKYIFDWFF